MEKIYKISTEDSSLGYFKVKKGDNLEIWGGLVSLDIIREKLGEPIAEKISKFYSNSLNKTKECNIVLLTDDELKQISKLEKKSKQ